jgi:hypothetical protein
MNQMGLPFPITIGNLSIQQQLHKTIDSSLSVYPDGSG